VKLTSETCTFLLYIYCCILKCADNKTIFRDLGEVSQPFLAHVSNGMEADWKNSDKCFLARGSYDVTQSGPGGKCFCWVFITEIITE
uniref:Uncharacterized protein n=1 Tax=Denticeps clupeoides TaxID=299321 RepID=A0AAY4BF65_9TELE